MRHRLRRYTAILVVFAILALISWAFFESQPDPNAIPTGTANTVAELREQVELPEFLQDLPEVGPFHWKGPENPNQPDDTISDAYTIRGKAKDPRVFLKWMKWSDEVSDEELNSSDVKPIAGWLTTGYAISLSSDGSFNINYYKFYGQYN